MKNNTSRHFQLFTVYAEQYKNLLKPDKYKNIVVRQLRFFIQENNIAVKAFVIMHNHFYIICNIDCGNNATLLFKKFLQKITQPIIYDLQKNHPVVLPLNRKYKHKIDNHFWNYQIADLAFPNENMYAQKLDDIHTEPVKAGLCEKAEDYMYSSAQYHQLDKDDFNWIAA